MSVLSKAILSVLVVASSCSASTATAPLEAPAVTRSAAAPSSMPDLCSYPAGYCEPCSGASCPAGDSGALCCVGDVCVVWSGSTCSGDLGWCSNYTTETDSTGIKVATCHDDDENP